MSNEKQKEIGDGYICPVDKCDGVLEVAGRPDPRQLTKTTEFIISTNLSNDVSLLGVAKAKIRDSKEDPWRDSYLACYRLADGRKLKLEVNEDLYHALHLIFDTILDIHS